MKAIQFGQNENTKILLRFGADSAVKNNVKIHLTSFTNFYLGKFRFTASSYVS